MPRFVFNSLHYYPHLLASPLWFSQQPDWQNFIRSVKFYQLVRERGYISIQKIRVLISLCSLLTFMKWSFRKQIIRCYHLKQPSTFFHHFLKWHQAVFSWAYKSVFVTDIINAMILFQIPSLMINIWQWNRIANINIAGKRRWSLIFESRSLMFLHWK